MSAASRSVAANRRVVGDRCGRTPVLALADAHATSTEPESATTPRWIASAAVSGRSRGGRVGRDGGDLAKQVHQLLDVADEVAGGELVVGLEQDREVLAGGPRMGDRCEPGLRWPGLGDPVLALVGRQLVSEAVDLAEALLGRLGGEPRLRAAVSAVGVHR